jgi:hypothetical protein
MAISSFPILENPFNETSRVYRATKSGTFPANIKPGVYEVKRQATTNIIIGSTTITPSTGSTIVFINEPQTEITFNSTISSNFLPWEQSPDFTGDNTSQGNISRAFYNGNTFLGFPQRWDRVYHSTNAKTWLALAVTGTTNFWLTDLAYDDNGTAFGAHTATSSATISFTTDYRVWSYTQASSATANNFVALYGNGNYVLAGQEPVSGNGTAQHATGLGYRTFSAPIALLANEYFYSGAFGNGLFVIGGSSGSLRSSTDGATWTARDPLFGIQRITRIVYNGEWFIAGGTSGTVRASTNGITWELRDPGFSTSHDVSNIVYNPDEGLWVLCPNESSVLKISTDTYTWQTRSTINVPREKNLVYAQGTYSYLSFVNSSTFRPYTINDILTEIESVPFENTYIILEYKGEIETLQQQPEPETFSITNSGSGAYLINGDSNATITLVRGRSYIFDINASGHPFWVQTVSGAYSSANIYSDGITGNGTEVGTLSWNVSLSAPNTLYYACQFHSSMQGTINIVDEN